MTIKVYQSEIESERDGLLLRLLKTPPQPRPHRERDEKNPTADCASGASAERLAPSA